MQPIFTKRLPVKVFVSLMILFCFTFVARGTADNLVPNGHFEQLLNNGLPAQWVVNVRGDVPYTAQLDPDGFNGDAALRMGGTGGPGYAVAVMRDIPASDYRNKTLQISAWYKGDIVEKLESETNYNFIRVEFYKIVDGRHVNAGTARTFRAPEAADDWTLVQEEFEVYPDTEFIWITIYFRDYDGEVQWARIDMRDAIPSSVRDEDGQRDSSVFYVSPDGNDGNDGSRDFPWATLSYASERAIPGDTVLFLPGEYEGVLRPTRSGTRDAPIVFKALERRTAVLTGQSGSAHAVRVRGVEHVYIEGFHIKPQSDTGRWMLIENAKHIHIDDILMEDAADSGLPFHITRSEHIYVRDSVFRQGGFNMARVGDSDYIVFEGNSITRAGHSPLQFYPDGSSRFVVIRGNVFHAAWGRDFEFFGTKDILFEDNIITNALHSSRSAAADAKFAVVRGLFRFNRIFRNWGGPIHNYPMRDQWVSNIRFYNNVFDDNYDYGIAMSNSHSSMETSDQMSDIVFANNVFFRNDAPGNHLQVRFTNLRSPKLDSHGQAIPRIQFLNNVVATDDPLSRATLNVEGTLTGIDMVESDSWQSRVGLNSAVSFSGNLEDHPRFVDAGIYNHAPLPDSPLLDNGRFLTSAIGSGQGHTIPVEDATYFYDGFGIEGEQGDVIVIGSPDQVARVVQVDRTSNQLTLDRTVRWNDGDAVSFPWTGDRPDIGLYELGEHARPSVQVIANPFTVHPGDDVHLSVSLFGIEDPAEIRWQLGDGTLAFGASLTHRYDAPYDYPIRVRVTSESGEIFRGTGYVVVRSERAVTDPFIHTTFEHSTYDSDDYNWLWYWKMNMGTIPIDWSHEVDPATGEGMLRVTNPGGGTLPLRLAPPEWDVDRDHWVYLEYRISPGTPIGLYLEGFAGQDGRTRRKWIAATAEERHAHTGPSIPYVLIDDGQWHSLLFDARRIRDDHPDVKFVQRLGMETLSPSSQGDTYWIREAAILPEEAVQCCVWQQKLRDRQKGHVDLLSPSQRQVVHGELNVDFDVVRYEVVGLGGDQPFGNVQRMVIEIDGEEIKSIDQWNNREQAVIDTNLWPDGIHGLTVRVTDENGYEFSDSVSFTIQNWTTMTDSSMAPRHMPFFGQAVTIDNEKTSARSSGWEFVENADSPLVSTTGGRVKISNAEEYLVWKAPDLQQFTVTVYSKHQNVENLVKFAAEVADDQWVELPFHVETEKTYGQVDKYVFQGLGPEGLAAEAFRLIVPADVPAGQLQLGDVTLEIRVTEQQR